MPCIFCVAVFGLVATAITAAVLDRLEEQLGSVADSPVQRTVDTESTTVYETTVTAPEVPDAQKVAAGKPVAVRVTVYKKHKRVRIQVMTHDISRAEAAALEDAIAKALGVEIVDRSSAHDEEKVREAFGEEAVEADRAEGQLPPVEATVAEAHGEQLMLKSPPTPSAAAGGSSDAPTPPPAGVPTPPQAAAAGQGNARFRITRFDVGPADLAAQLPLEATMLRFLPGPDRPDYFLARLDRAVLWRTTTAALASAGADPAAVVAGGGVTAGDGSVTISTSLIVGAARLAGEQLHNGMVDLGVNLALVLDPAVEQAERLELDRCAYVAVALITDVPQA